MIIKAVKIRMSAVFGSVFVLISCAIVLAVYSPHGGGNDELETYSQAGYIKWVDFTPTYDALKKALALDVKSHTSEESVKLDWIELLAYLAAKYGGDFKKFKESDLNAIAEKLSSGQDINALTESMKYYKYYHEAYSAVLGEFTGCYRVEAVSEDGTTEWRERYGLKVFSPVAKGYYYNDYDDFGAGRSYGYKRRHLGHDLMGSVGTPIIAVESGVVEELGWNQYGGWRIGIRSFDSKRYYYYAHLRQNRPYAAGLEKGSVVTAGDVIGYMGRTGYSSTENVNNITQTHLHLGMQLIFDESQKDGVNQIWIDMYPITKLLLANKSAVVRDENKEYHRKYGFEELKYED